MMVEPEAVADIPQKPHSDESLLYRDPLFKYYQIASPYVEKLSSGDYDHDHYIIKDNTQANRFIIIEHLRCRFCVNFGSNYECQVTPIYDVKLDDDDFILIFSDNHQRVTLVFVKHNCAAVIAYRNLEMNFVHRKDRVEILPTSKTLVEASNLMKDLNDRFYFPLLRASEEGVAAPWYEGDCEDC